jgi:acyl-CoA thioesterase
MDEQLRNELVTRSQSEPFGNLLGLQVVRVDEGVAIVRMRVRGELQNIFGAVHGGAIFSLVDEAFQLACNSHGILSVALNVNITYVAAPDSETILEARADEMYKTNRTASYHCEIREVGSRKLIATAQALAYRTSKHVHRR